MGEARPTILQEVRCRFETSLVYIARPCFKEGKGGGEEEEKEDYFCDFTSHSPSSKAQNNIPGSSVTLGTTRGQSEHSAEPQSFTFFLLHHGVGEDLQASE